jgi:hypothetical protein
MAACTNLPTLVVTIFAVWLGLRAVWFNNLETFHQIRTQCPTTMARQHNDSGPLSVDPLKYWYVRAACHR